MLASAGGGRLVPSGTEPRPRADRPGQDAKPTSRYSATLSLVTTAE